MARRRRRFAGTEVQHRARGGVMAADVRRGIKWFRRSIADGNCRAALSALTRVAFYGGKFSAERSWAAPKVWSRGGTVANTVQQGLRDKFYKACVAR